MKGKIDNYKSNISCEIEFTGESIEQEMRRATEEQTPIENVAPIMYTDRKDGVLPSTDIRTDRWDIAQKAMGHVNKTKAAKIQETIDKKNNQDNKEE